MLFTGLAFAVQSVGNFSWKARGLVFLMFAVIRDAKWPSNIKAAMNFWCAGCLESCRVEIGPSFWELPTCKLLTHIRALAIMSCKHQFVKEI